jgi:hypothetical protein
MLPPLVFPALAITIALTFVFTTFVLSILVQITLAREYLRGKYHCTVDLLFD